jgi:hypothetical protein
VARLTSQGCLADVEYYGAPSATSGSFLIHVSDVVNQQPGLLVHSHARNQFPFMGGTWCLAPAFVRTSIGFSGGSPGTPLDCTGHFNFDMNGWIQTGVDPSLVPGTRVTLQYWFRDPVGTFGVGLSNALDLVIQP